jgi:uncharacterized protein (TIGR03790 family)
VAECVYSQTGENILLVVNRNDASSVEIGAYYRPRRSVPIGNVCELNTTSEEEIGWDVYERNIEQPIAACLHKAELQERVLYLVLTRGVPMRVRGAGSGLMTETSSVDSELTLLYGKLKGSKFQRAGWLPNPYFRKREEAFRHPQFPIYLVTRLAAYDVAGVKGMVDRSLRAHNRGRFVIDLKSEDDGGGNSWLRSAAIFLPADRVVLDESPRVLYDVKDVIGYASWGSNDPNRKSRKLGFQWLPGAIATEFVSTNARTLQKPPDNWTYTTWADRFHFFGGSPQGLSGDLLLEGATGVSGNVAEPYLQACARPEMLFPAYYSGRNLADSFYASLPFLSWMGVVLGDPLCSLGKP